MRVIVCGSRDWTKSAPIYTYLDGLALAWERKGSGEFLLGEGGANGADKIASEWFDAREENYGPFDAFRHECYEADWKQYGKVAGHIRNKEMLELVQPQLVLAFKNNFNWSFGNGGTENMVKIAREANVPTYLISEA